MTQSEIIQNFVRNNESDYNVRILERLYPNGFEIDLQTFQNLINNGFEPKMVWPVTGPITYSDNITWYFNGLLHKNDGPAIKSDDGSECWYQHNQLHREDGPAILYADGTQMWYQHDELHREDGPAIVQSDGTKIWYVKGKCRKTTAHFHKVEEKLLKLAIENTEEQHNLDILHKLYPDGYCINLETYQNLINNRYSGIIKWPITGLVNYPTGVQCWYKDGKRHREDGPAVIFLNIHEMWYKDGKLHREDGPAIVRSNGSQDWYQNDVLHREDGPAVIEANGNQEWWVKGIFQHD